jgi:hypothetical protein
MRPELEVAEEIIRNFKVKRYAKGPRNEFGFIRDDGIKIVVSRENGEDTPITREYIAQAVAAVRKDPSIYILGPSSLKPYIKRRIQSPLWALLHLVSLNEITR